MHAGSGDGRGVGDVFGGSVSGSNSNRERCGDGSGGGVAEPHRSVGGIDCGDGSVVFAAQSIVVEVIALLYTYGSAPVEIVIPFQTPLHTSTASTRNRVLDSW